MSSEIWQVGQKMSASDMYKDVKENGFEGIKFLRSDMMAVVQLTKACEKMIQAYNEITEDQTSYLVELDNESLELENLQADTEAKIKELMAEIKELEEKKENGTITEEEEAELESKKTELDSFHKSSAADIKTRTDKLTDSADERVKESRSKISIANDYGETTVDKGTPLAETKVKGGFFRKLFGSTGKSKKQVGENAVRTGNELLDKVADSVELNNDIDTKLKKHVKK